MNDARKFLLLAALCALASAAFLLPGLGGAFLLDDKPTITENALVQVTALQPEPLMRAAYSFGAGGGSRVLPMLTFAVDYWRAGLDPTAFKITNIAIHVLTTWVLARLFQNLLLLAAWSPKHANYASIGMACAWAMHPLQVSSVLYIVQRMQTMATLFMVLALIAYLAMRKAQIAGQRSRQFGTLTVLCWTAAMACKEDAILLPVYTLALEVTLLGFRAAVPSVASRWRLLYLGLVLLATALFTLWVLPRQWHWDAYPGRDFSTPERLLTQGRVLAMYLGQIVWPLPGRLPFYYDDLQPSRGLLTPWTTLPALLLVFGLLILAWRVRHTRPLLALGIFLFFGGHAITSNVLGLELAFEHRNQFPLLGIILAITDLLAASAERLQARIGHITIASLAILGALGTATLVRAQAWGTTIGFAEYGIRIAPTSERAWINLCQTHFEMSGYRPGNAHFGKALDACGKGSALADGATNLTNLVLLKTIDGSIRQQDWRVLFNRMRQVTMTPSNVGVVWHLVRYSNGDRRIDPRNVLAIIDIVNQRSHFRPEELVAFGYYANKNQLHVDALRYFTDAVRNSPPGSQLPAALLADLRREGLPLIAERLQTMLEDGRVQELE